MSAFCLAADDGAVLSALVDTILPADQTGPGAVAARVPEYILNCLEGELAASLPAYQAGLRAVEQAALTKARVGFAEAPREVRDAVVADLADDRMPGAEGFFALVRTHVIEGFLGDPARGGNADLIGWRTIGYPGPRAAVSLDEQAVGYRPPAAARSAYELLPLVDQSESM